MSSRILLVCAAGLAPLGCRAPVPEVTRHAPIEIAPVESAFANVDMVFEARALGGSVQIAFGEGAEAGRVAVVQRCFSEARRIERTFSVWSEDSELARWNADRVAGARPVSRELADGVALALAFGAKSGGAFDPTVAVLLRRLGFYEQVEAAPIGADELAELRTRVGFEHVRVVPGAGAAPPSLARDVAGVELDLSGMAKGLAVDRIAEMLAEAGFENAFVTVGRSSLFALGDEPGGRGWAVRVPVPGGGVEIWRLRDEGLATSGRLAFEVTAGGLPTSHIVDPATGRPTGSRTELAIVRGPSACEADMAATALVALGPEAARAWFSSGVLGPGRTARIVAGDDRRIETWSSGPNEAR